MSLFKKIAIFFFSFLLILSFDISANDNLSLGYYYTLDADNISFHSHNSVIIASGNVNFKSEFFTLKTNKLSINLEEKVLNNSGENFSLIEEDREITGEKIYYNYEKNTGQFYNAESKIDNLNFKGKKINFVEKDEYDALINEASFTKCVLDEPHYQIKAERLKIYPDSKVVAENVQFWWGNLKLFALPSFVMEYISDEESGKNALGSSSPIPRLAYNSSTGFSIEMIYPYELTERSTGKVTMGIEQRGEQNYNIRHKHQLNDKIALLGNYNYNRKKLNENELNIENKISMGFNYNDENLSLLSTLGYNYIFEQREEVIDFTYNLPYSYNLDFYHQYVDEKRNKNAYILSSTMNTVDWSLKYRKGYDLNQLPYLDLDFDEYYGFKADIGLGILEENNNSFNKVKVDLKYNKNIMLTENSHFTLKESYKHHFYQQVNSSEIKDYKGILSTLTLATDFKANEKLDISGNISWNKNITTGDYLINNDKIEEKDSLNYNLSLNVDTAEPQSYLNFKNNGKYDLIDKELKEIKVGIERKLDCHSYSFNYEFINKEFTIDFSIF